jgi:hypothetical protein
MELVLPDIEGGAHLPPPRELQHCHRELMAALAVQAGCRDEVCPGERQDDVAGARKLDQCRAAATRRGVESLG